ncbi:putative ribonuclease H-like domain-containing protein [Tanacetum coccineum]
MDSMQSPPPMVTVIHLGQIPDHLIKGLDYMKEPSNKPKPINLRERKGQSPEEDLKGMLLLTVDDLEVDRRQGQAVDCKEFKVSDVKELKFNLLSVSQICDKKHNVLFTDKECLILSPKFKFVDEELVILRAPRKNDVYSLDLKNIIPSGGVTCLVAKATKDEAVLWHRRLGHVNFKNINKFQVTPKVSHMHAVKRIFSDYAGENHDRRSTSGGCQYLGGRLVSWQCKKQTIVAISSTEAEYIAAASCCAQTEHNADFHQIVDYLTGCSINYSLLVDPDLIGPWLQQFWATASLRSINEVPHIRAMVAGKRVLISEETIRADLLFDDADGVDCFPKQVIWDSLRDIGYEGNLAQLTFSKPLFSPQWKYLVHVLLHCLSPKSTSWEQFGTNIASALVGLATNQKFNFSLMIMNGMLGHIANGHNSISRIEAIRLFLAFASFMGFIVYQMDVKSAFLYGNITEEVYVKQPPGFEDPAHPNKVYRVVKALYGLHQAPRAWYERLSTFLLKHGYRRGAIDKTLFIKKDRRDIMLVQVYVDDIIFGSTKSSMVKDFEDLMQKEFKMSSMGELTFFLGLQVKQTTAGIFLSQDKYVKDILNKFDFRTIKPASTPIEAHKSLGKDEEGEEVDVHLYRSMIGCLMYLTASRPDIMFAVCLCARFQVTPKVSHMHAVKRIFRYLKHQPKLGLWYPKDSPFHLEAFSDSDYAGDNHDRRSTSGGCQYLGRRLVSWQCKKQTIVAISSTEAEYVAAASCCAQVLWMQNQLLDYGFNFMNTEIHIDNESTICIVKNPVLHSKTKHIQIRHHFIRDCYEQRLINVVKVHTDDNVADLLTKGFDLARFNFLVVTIGMMNP